jgi:ceramide glucosyltransferase
MELSLLLALLGVVLLVDIAWTHVQLRRGIAGARPARPKVAHYPSVSVIRPVRGHDVGAEENLAAALDTGYPGEVETIFVLDDERDPAYPLVRAAVDAHRRAGLAGHASLVIAGPPPVGRTGKLNAMMVGLKAARGELVAFGDSDTRPDREVLRVIVETLLGTPFSGAAFAPVVVASPARTAGDVGYALLLNALYGTGVAVLAADAGDLPFIMGQLMVLRRDALAAIGGLGCAEGQLVDDMYIGACLASVGYRNVMSSHPLAIVNAGMSFGDFMRLFRRWMLFARGGLPLSFTWGQWQRNLEFWVAALAAGVAIAWGHALAALVLAAATLGLGLSLLDLEVAFGGARVPPRYAWMALALFVLGPPVMLATFARRRVMWRGRHYAIDPEARLA